MLRGKTRKQSETESAKKAVKRDAIEEKIEPALKNKLEVDEENNNEKVEVTEKTKEETKTDKEKDEVESKKPKLTRRELREKERLKEKLASWKPKTKLGMLVKKGDLTNIDQVLNTKRRILESEIVDWLLPDLSYDLIAIGQSKGKFGGGKRRAWRQTQRKTAEGNVPKFSALAVIGDKKGHVGVGYGKSKETLPAREKAIRQAKLNIMKVNRGCGSFDCMCNDPHSIPFKVSAKEGSVKVILMPAPRGTGLVAEDECKKILGLAGIKDIYTRTFGKTRTKFNMVKACIKALNKLNSFSTKNGRGK